MPKINDFNRNNQQFVQIVFFKIKYSFTANLYFIRNSAREFFKSEVQPN